MSGLWVFTRSRVHVHELCEHREHLDKKSVAGHHAQQRRITLEILPYGNCCAKIILFPKIERKPTEHLCVRPLTRARSILPCARVNYTSPLPLLWRWESRTRLTVAVAFPQKELHIGLGVWIP